MSSCSSGTEHLLQYREEIIFWKQNMPFGFTLYFPYNYDKAGPRGYNSLTLQSADSTHIIRPVCHVAM